MPSPRHDPGGDPGGTADARDAGPTAAAPIRTLIVEDDPLIADAHRLYVGRVPGFRVVDVAATGTDALRILAARPVDLVLLDVYLPDMTGLDLCRALRGRGNGVDVIAVTSARDLPTVRAAVSLGIVQYLIKPFQFATFRAKLAGYADFRAALGADRGSLAQDELDRLLDGLRSPRRAQLPKGLSDSTLATVVQAVRSASPLTAAELAELVGVSAPTSRRYLEYLSEQRLVTGHPRYGGPGRPEMVYQWSAADP
jgi:response regulator of citrate/malate metabolism